MFYRSEKKKTTEVLPIKDLISTTSPEDLLADGKRSLLLKQIRQDCPLEDALFDTHCLSVLHNLIHYCQHLPETSHSYYSQAGGFLDYALNRTQIALELLKNHLLLNEEGHYSPEQLLWLYALFSASLLKGIGKLNRDYNIDCYDKSGKFLSSWNPLLGSLTASGDYYRYSFQKETDVATRYKITLLFVHTFMPTEGYTWIASNHEVLTAWLALLAEDTHNAGTLGSIFRHADALAMQRYFNEQLAKLQEAANLSHGRSAFGLSNTKPADLEQLIGIEFIVWLKSALESNLLTMNELPLLMVPGGLLLTSDVFKLFIQHNKKYSNWQSVENAFLKLNLHQINADKNVFLRFQQHNNQQMHSGLVLAHYGVVLPSIFRLENLNTGKSSSISALEFIHMAHETDHHFSCQEQSPLFNPLKALNAQGKWQIMETQPRTTNSLFKRMGGLSGG